MMAEVRGELLRKRVGLVLGLLAFAAIAIPDTGLKHLPQAGSRPAFAAATAVLMAIWWFTEAVPIHWTACVPLIAYPLFEIHGRGVWGGMALSAVPFVDAYIFMFLGGMMIGAASEQWNLHRRVALHIMRAIGTGPKRLLLGILVATASVSLWISNTATAVMMMPIGMALLAQLEAVNGGRKLWHFGTAVMLGIAYGCNVGGIGTKIGTGPNSIFCGWVSQNLGQEISFLRYLGVALPFVVLFVPVLWLVLWRLARHDDLAGETGRDVLDAELARLGPMGRNEKKVACVFAAAAALWILGGVLSDAVGAAAAPRVRQVWPGFKFLDKHYEAWVAMAAGLSLFALRVLSWRAFLRIPWATLLLLGGGFAMAEGIKESGLAAWMQGQLGGLAGQPLFVQLLVASAAGVGLSAVASNTATITVMLQVLPRNLTVLMATTMASSCDFMLPAGTPPNAIVFGSGYIRLPVMIRTGFLLDLAASLLIAAYAFLYVRFLFA